MMDVELEYVSVGCSRTPHALDWSPSGVVAYAANESVALAREDESGRGPVKVFATLAGHRGRVNCVRWITTSSSSTSSSSSSSSTPDLLLSGGVDGKVMIWRKNDEGEFLAAQEMTSHKSSVTCVAGVYLLPSNREEGEAPPIRCLVSSASSDSTIKIWEGNLEAGSFTEVQTIDFGRGFSLCVEFCLLPSSPYSGEPLLISGCDDAKVHIYCYRERKFVRGLSLSGHKDWVRDVGVVRERNVGGAEIDDLLLASCSQDNSIRLWRVSQQQQQTSKQQQEGDEELKLKGNIIVLESGASIAVTLESVLIGHDDWVYSVYWWHGYHDNDQSDCSSSSKLQLLSCSMDKTVIVWRADTISGVWMEEVRVGEVGGNTLGFYGGQISPGGQLILAHDYQGGVHLWGRQQLEKEEEKEREEEGGDGGGRLDVWKSLPTIGGHFGEVQGLSWEPTRGLFLLSVSSDQTARLHALWSRPDRESVWLEIARPQIHGHDMTCVAMTTSLQYTSGADEKVMRVFGAPANFVSNLLRISGEQLKTGSEEEVPLGASVPSLGLSNKAVFTIKPPKRGQYLLSSLRRLSFPETLSLVGGGEEKEKEKITKNPFADYIPSFRPVDLTEPPVEAHLLQNTLWPETQKIYGHGYEIYCLATSPNGCYVASACKASKAEHAVIRLWEVSSWKQLRPLEHHSLTVTHLAFSPSSHLLLATSRDRTWSLWKHTDVADSNPPYVLCACLNKATKLHTRIIWTAAWTHDSSCFATGSRDKKVLLWRQGGSEGCDCGEGWKVIRPSLDFDHSVTALNFAPHPVTDDNRHILAVGLESGHIHVYYCSLQEGSLVEWNLAISFDARLCHTATVKQLSWRPQRAGGEAKQCHEEHDNMLASCSHDNSVKLFRITRSKKEK